jgi:hypothetical protein
MQGLLARTASSEPEETAYHLQASNDRRIPANPEERIGT